MSTVALAGPALTALGVAGALIAVRQGRPWAYGVALAVRSRRGFLAGLVLFLLAHATFASAFALRAWRRCRWSSLATGVASPAPALVVGAMLVAGSDLAVARERFATKGFANKAIGLPAYYLGQTFVALALGGA